jgi:DNA-binding beta-propeller fold protein YncE
VYVADTSNHRIQYFDADGAFLGQWGGEGRGYGQFEGAQGVAAAPDGTVYVADLGNHRVQFFTADGTYLGQWATEGMGFISGPTSVAVGPDGKTVYVTVRHRDHILLFDAAWSFSSQWGNEGSNPGEFKRPDGVAVAPDGTVYVVDQGNNRVQAFCVSSWAEGNRPRATPGTGTPVVPGPVATPV